MTDRRPRLLGDAGARRRGALVQGDPRRRRSARVRRRLSDAADAHGVGALGAGRAAPSGVELGLLAALGALQTLAFVDTDLWPLQIARDRAARLARRRARRRGARPRSAAPSAPPGSCAGTWWLFVSMHRYGGLPALAGGARGARALRRFSRSTSPRRWRRWRAGAPRSRARAGALLFAAAWLLAELARGVHLHRLSVGRERLCAGRLAARRLRAVARRLRRRRGRRRPRPPAFGFSPLRRGARLAGAGRRARRRARRRRARSAGSTSRRPTRRAHRLAAAGQRAAGREVRAAHVPRGAGLRPATQLDAARGELVVGPETVIPLLPGELDAGYWDGAAGALPRARPRRAVGLPLGDPAARLHQLGARPLGGDDADCRTASTATTSTTWCRSASSSRPAFAGSRELMNIPLGDFNRGPLTAPSFDVGGERVAPNICYEDLFGEELAARFVDPRRRRRRSSPTSATSAGSARRSPSTQHLQISRMRTLELQRPMIRATNTGATAVIDHRGVVAAGAAAVHARHRSTARSRAASGLTPFAALGRPLRPVAAVARSALALLRRRLAAPGRPLKSFDSAALALAAPAFDETTPGAMLTFQQIILRLQAYWAEQGCALLQPYDMEVGAGTFHTATFLRALGPEPWRRPTCSRRAGPKDGRYGENPNRLQHYYQYQVVLKPSPADILDLYLGSLEALGFDLKAQRRPLRRGRLGEPDARRLGPRLGGLAERHGGHAVHLLPAGRRPRLQADHRRDHLRPRAPGDVPAGRRQRLRPAVDRRASRYGDVYHQNEVEQSTYNFEQSDVEFLLAAFADTSAQAKRADGERSWRCRPTRWC